MPAANQAVASTVAAGAAVAAPGASATIVTLGVLPAGTYRVSAVVVNTGTAETTAAGFQNFGFRRGTNLVSALPCLASPVRQEFERVVVDGTQSINVIAVAAAIAGSFYVASLSATRIAA